MPSVTLALTETDLQPLPSIEALIFDWDGTLFDNHHFNYLVMRDALAADGVSITEAWFQENAGHPARTMVARAGEGLDPLRVLARRDELAETLVHEVKPVAAVHALLTQHRNRKLAVVTGSERSNIEATLRHFGLTFDTIVSQDLLSRGKPDPEGYLLALRKLGVEAGRAVVYEDSDQGIDAALAAGIDVIDVRGLG